MTTITKLTKEQLIEEVKRKIAVAERYPDLDVARIEAEIFKIALVVLTAEPVAWRLVDSPESSVTVTDNEKMAAIWKRNGRNVQPLYSTAHGSADAVGMVVSEGRQPSAHNPESRIFEVLVESGYEPVPGDKLYAAPPAPVVPEEIEPDSNNTYDYVDGWNACRAALLQGAEPVSNHDELALYYLQGQKDGLEWAAQLAEANHPHTGDWLYDDPLELAKAIRKGPDMPEFAGSSPVTPDGWISCSERMPEQGA